MMLGGRAGARQEDFGRPGDRQLYVDELHIYRQWRFGATGPYLSGLNLTMLWEHHGWSQARCHRGGFEACTPAPGESCKCGFYGWYLPDRLWEEAHDALFGVASVAGVSVLGSKGLRAARMRPTALALPVVDRVVPRCPCGCSLYGSQSVGREYVDALRAALHKALPDVALYDSREELAAAVPPADWASLVGSQVLTREEELLELRSRMTGIVQNPTQLQKFVSFDLASDMSGFSAMLDDLVLGRAKTKKQNAEERAAAQRVQRPLTPQEKALEARRNRSTGPAALRDPFTRRGRG